MSYNSRFAAELAQIAAASLGVAPATEAFIFLNTTTGLLSASISTGSAQPVALLDAGTTLVANSFLFGSSTGNVQSTLAATNGQVLIGSTGASPVAASLTAGTGITITPGAGTITIASTSSGTVGPGTVNRVSKFTAATTIGDSNITDNGTTITALSSGAGNPVFAVQGAAAQTADLQRWQSSTPTVLSSITAAGVFNSTTFTASSFAFVDSAQSLVSTAAPTNGQLLIGSTGANPVVAAITAGTGISVTNGAGSITIALSTPVSIANGGTNSGTALNNNRIMVSSAGAIVEAAALTNGQLLIGSTGAAPVAASITAGTGITVTPGAGTITIASTSSGTVGPGTVNRVSKFTAATTIGDSNVSDDGTTVTVLSSGAANPVLFVRGAAAQTGDLQRWQDSTPATLASVSSDGTITSTSGFTGTLGTITTDKRVISGTATWNAGGVTFYGGLINITDTASGANSRLISIQLAGVEKLYVDKAGDTTINGNLTVNGTTTTINSTVVNIADRVIHMNYAPAGTVPVPSAICGFEVERGSIASVYRDGAGMFWVEGSTLFRVAFNTNADDANLGANVGLTAGTITSDIGTITAAQNSYAAVATWNNGAVTFTAADINITDTASAAASRLLALRVGGADRMIVTKDGAITSATLTANAFIYSATASVITSTAAPTNGQLLIGSTGAAPVVSTITAGTGITVTNGAGTITIASTSSGSVGPGTVNRVSKFTAATTVGDSNISDNGTTITALSSGAANPVFAVQGAAAQTADLQRWQSSTPTVLSSITAAGLFNSTTFTASSFAFVNAAQSLVSTAAPTNGQLLIGSTGANPVVATITAGTGITVTNGAGSITIALSTPVSIANGGTNSSTALNNNRIMVSSAGAIVEAAALTNGQLLIGSTGAAPVAAAITAGLNMFITNGAGSISLASLSATTNQTANYSALSTDTAIYVANPGAGTVTVTIPSAVTAGAGKIYIVKRTNAGGGATNRVSITSATNIDGVATQDLNTQYSSITVQSDGTIWNIV